MCSQVNPACRHPTQSLLLFPPGQAITCNHFASSFRPVHYHPPLHFHPLAHHYPLHFHPLAHHYPLHFHPLAHHYPLHFHPLAHHYPLHFHPLAPFIRLTIIRCIQFTPTPPSLYWYSTLSSIAFHSLQHPPGGSHPIIHCIPHTLRSSAVLIFIPPSIAFPSPTVIHCTLIYPTIIHCTPPSPPASPTVLLFIPLLSMALHSLQHHPLTLIHPIVYCTLIHPPYNHVLHLYTLQHHLLHFNPPTIIHRNFIHTFYPFIPTTHFLPSLSIIATFSFTRVLSTVLPLTTLAMDLYLQRSTTLALPPWVSSTPASTTHSHTVTRWIPCPPRKTPSYLLVLHLAIHHAVAPAMFCVDSTVAMFCTDSMVAMLCTSNTVAIFCTDNMVVIFCTDSMAAMFCTDSMVAMFCTVAVFCIDSMVAMFCTVAVFCIDSMVAMFCTDSTVAIFCIDSMVAMFCTDSTLAIFCIDSMVVMFCTDNMVAMFRTDGNASMFCTDRTMAMFLYRQQSVN